MTDSSPSGGIQLSSEIEKQLFNNCHFGVVIIDQQRRILNVNQRFCAIFGYSAPTELIGQPSQIFHLSPASFNDFGELVFAKVTRKEALNVQYQLKKKDGTAIWAEISGEPATGDGISIWTVLDISQRKEAEIKLRESEEKFRVAFTTTPDAIALTRVSDGSYVDVNEGFLSLTGYSREELIGTSSLLLNIWDNQQDRQKLLQGLKNNGRVKELSAVFLKKDGGKIDGLMSARFIEVGGEKLILSITRDITQRKLAEEKFRTLIKEASIGIALADAQTGTLLECNQALAEMVERTCEELVGQPQKILHPDSPLKGPVTEAFAKRRDANKPATAEIKCQSANGRIFDVEIKATPLKLGQMDVMLGFFQDISERKKHLESVKKSEARFKSLANLLPEAVYETDIQMKLTYANRKAYELFGYTEQDFQQGVYVTHLVVREEAQIAAERIRELFNGTATKSQEYHCIKKDGTVFPALLHSDVIRAEGQPVGLRGVLVDLTQRKQEEEALLKLRKLESVGVLAGGVAHNFNNTLAAIIGSLELARLKVNHPEEVLRYLHIAAQASLRSRDLVSQILTYSRQGIDRKGPIDLSLITEETLNLLRSTLPATITLKFQLTASENTTIQADPSRVQEALLNLCNNAVQAMDEVGELEIQLARVELEQQDIPAEYPTCRPGHYVQLKVTDNGCGMDTETQKKIFDPFFTTKAVGEGTGMGLATVQGIVEQHEGLIRVHSVPKQGTSFELYFPTLEGPFETSLEQQQNASIPHGRGRILFIDDDAMFAELGQEMLTELGYTVTIMTSSAEALQRFKADPEKFDLVVTDQTMPELTGKELIGQIKKIRPAIPAILATGYSCKINEAEAVQLGIAAFCQKPLNLAELAQTVSNVLERQ